MIVVYSPEYQIDIGAHVFPTAKYRRVFERIRAVDAATPFIGPRAAAWDDLALVHTADYLGKIRSGRFGLGELAQLEIPWSPAIVEGFRLMTGGTIEAARLALDLPDGRAFHVGGGFHHAFADHGEGFCLFNDVAVAVRVLRKEGLIRRAAVIDLDVHHGNGTAAIFARDPDVFTFSMHQENNYPAVKPRGSLDIGLSDAAGDDLYLRRLEEALPNVAAHGADIVFYLAGADPYADDQLGGLALTREGLRARDRMVLDACAAHGVPTVVLLAGGYARRLEDTVDIHVATFEETCRRVERTPPRHPDAPHVTQG
jgi:acetoin utilization deacetylase AcuC-like enzyme